MEATGGAPGAGGDAREARLFLPGAGGPVRAVGPTPPDSFYTATGADVVAQYESLARRTRALDSAPLLTGRQRAAAAAQRAERFTRVTVRLRLPDRFMLQGVFTPDATVGDLRAFLRAALRAPDAVRFHLFVAPPKAVLADPRRTLWQEGLVPAALVHVGIDDGPGDTPMLLREDLLARAEAPPQPPDPPAESEAAAAAAVAAERRAEGKRRADGGTKLAESGKRIANNMKKKAFSPT